MTTKTESVAMFPNAFLHESFTEPPNVIIINDARPGERMCFLHADGKWIPASSKHESPYIFPREEATFRLQLYQSPREALGPFLRAKELEYVGTCGECGGIGEHYQNAYVAGGEIYGPDCWPCDSCHGTGGPPDPLLLAGAADWFEEMGDEMRSGVLRDVSQGESK